MGLMPTRRAWKRTFRRLRIYVPLALIGLLAMAVFLPLSAGWMARRAEREILAQTGLAVSVDRLELTAAAATVSAYGITLGADGDRPFRVGRVFAEGSPRELLAGGEKWPASLTVDALPNLDFRKQPDGVFRIEGPYRTLLDAIAGMKMPKGAPSTGSKRPRLGNTPRVTVRNVGIEIDPPLPRLSPIAITVDTLVLDGRATGAAPYDMELKGAVSTDSIESFDLKARYVPADQRLAVRGTLTGARIPFYVPQLGSMVGRVKNLGIEFLGDRKPDGKLSGSLTVQAGQFELMQDRIGGERWNDEPLEIRLRAEFDPATQEIALSEFSVLGREIDVSGHGKLIAKGAYPGDATLRIARLPAGALAVGRGELLDKLAVQVDPSSTSTTLRLDARARGDFARAMALDFESSLRLAGWRLRAAGIPEAIEFRDLDVMVSNRELAIRSLDVGVGGMSLSARGTVPVSQQGRARPGAVILRAEGDAEDAFDLAARMGAIPPEVTRLKAPVRIDATLQMNAAYDADLSTARLSNVERTERLVLTWGEGELGLSMLSEPVHLSPGEVRIDAGGFIAKRLEAAVGGITLRASGELHRPEGQPAKFRGEANVAGEIPALVFLAGQFAPLPPLPVDLVGRFSATLSAAGAADAPLESEYQARLLLENVSATIATPHRPVAIANLSAELVADPLVVQLRRLTASLPDALHGDSVVELDASATDTGIRANAKLRSHLEVLSSILLKDLSDLHLEGVVPATATASLTPAEPLPPGPDAIRRWIAFFGKPGLKLALAGKGTGDAIIDYEARYRPEGPLNLTPRDFPVAMNNFRGSAVATPEGIRLHEVLVDLGADKDVKIHNALIDIGAAIVTEDGVMKAGQPTVVVLDLDAKTIDTNQWMHGWGEQPWASPPVSYPSRWRQIPDPVHFVRVVANMQVEKTKFLQFEAGPLHTRMEVDIKSRVPVEMKLADLSGRFYDGDTTATVAFRFPIGEKPHMAMDAEFRGVDLKPFMNALREREQAFDGLMDGGLHFEGQLLNYPTYKGTGHYFIEKSSVVGSVLFEYAANLIRVNSTTGGRDCTIGGHAECRDMKVYMNDLTIISPAANFAAEGYIDFHGRLFFDVTLNILSKRLQGIPVISLVGDVIDAVGDRLVSYRVRGKLREPEYFPVPAMMKGIQDLGERAKGAGSDAEELRPKAQQRRR